MVHIADKNNRGKYSNAACGLFLPQHPEKYVGKDQPEYKSALELKFMLYVDQQ